MDPEDRRMLQEIHTNTAVLRQKLDDHVSNSVIHQIPPCEEHKALSKKLWAIVMLFIGSMAASIWSLIAGKA